MIRKISFDDAGNIVVRTETHTEVISNGVVLLTRDQVTQAKAHRWEPFGDPDKPFTQDTDPPLYAVHRR